MENFKAEIESLKKEIGEYPNFPKHGILFRDLFSVLRKPKLLALLRDILVAAAKRIQPPVECVVGLDARGFLLGPIIALDLEVPFVPVRKKGKLPGNVTSATYSMEYGENCLEMQNDSIKKGQKVLIVDDLLATGGSLRATCELVGKLKGEVVGCLVLMELTDLGGKKNVPAEIHSIIKY